MQKIVLFLLLFLFSFVIAHDTVITVVSDKYTVHESLCDAHEDSLAPADTKTQMDIAKLHTMFHFVALAPVCVGICLDDEPARAAVLYRFRPTSAEQSSSYKPPIA